MQKMLLPPIHNVRSPEQWKAIRKHVVFEGTHVLDIGCGYGDMLFGCLAAGADRVTGVEQDKNVFQQLLRRSKICYSKYDNDSIGEIELINSSFDAMSWPTVNIAICFAVLPYTSDPDSVINRMSQCSEISLIECQYHEDGPGFEWLKDDEDMELWLAEFFSDIKKIGQTLVTGRNKYRSIWMCKK